jgi:hypothetical protein
MAHTLPTVTKEIATMAMILFSNVTDITTLHH